MKRCMSVEPIGTAPPLPAGTVTQAEFLAFYDASVAPLFGYLFRATGGDRDLAEDTAQEVFAVALRRARLGDRGALALPWAISVGRNRLIDHWRKTARAQRRLELIAINTVIDTDEGPDLLCEGMQRLPSMQRAAVALHYLDGFTVDEVAHRLGKSAKAIESLLSRARHTLRTAGGADHE